MTLPAHRFLGREERQKNDDESKTYVFDFDETITAAPEQLGRLATAIRGMGDRVVVLTGNTSPRTALVKRLADYGFPFDDLIQYEDNGSDGIARSKYMKQLDAYVGIDDRAARAATYVKVCPQLFLIAAPTSENKDDAKGAKKAAKKAVKKLQRSEQRSAVPPPPHLRVSDSTENDQPEHECGTCSMFDVEEGVCWGYGNIPVSGEWVCDSWALDPDWQDQDAAQDAADGELDTPGGGLLNG